MSNTSASHILHDLLSKQEIGFRFSLKSLKTLAKEEGHDFTDGAITGFITRSVNKQTIEVVGVVKGKGHKPFRLYEVVSHEGWKFKPAGHGSYPARESQGKPRNTFGQLDLPTLEEMINNQNPTKSEVNAYYAAKNGIPMVNIPIDTTMSISSEMLEQFSKEIDYENGSLVDKLINIAIAVSDLENKPEKSLKDYTAEELIEELKTRIK